MDAVVADKGAGRFRWMVLLTVVIGTFLGRLDQTIVNLALPKIITDFSITVNSAGWIATAYILANAVFVPVWGKLGDTIGRKKVYVLGFIGFIIGSVLAGFAWNLSSMIVFRVIQAIAGSADYPTAMGIIAVTFKEGKERAQALGLWSASFAAASVFGPLVGGPLIDNFGWRSVFLVNLPVGIIGLMMAMKYVTESKVAARETIFDWWGAVALGGALSALVLVLDRGMDWGWAAPESFLCYVAFIVSFGFFVRIEQTHPEPIVDFKFFKIPAFTNTLINNFVVFMGMMGGVFLIPVFAQTFMGYTATQAGYLFMPMAAMMMLASPLGGSLTGKVQPRYVIAASTFVAAIGLFLFNGLDPRSGPLDIMFPLSIMAFGLGFGMAQRTNIIASVVPAHEVGIASSILALGRNIAGAFGIAVFATILKSTTESKLLAIARLSSINSSDPAMHGAGLGLMMLKAQVSSYGTVFTAASAILLFGAFYALFVTVDKREMSKTEVFVE